MSGGPAKPAGVEQEAEGWVVAEKLWEGVVGAQLTRQRVRADISR